MRVPIKQIKPSEKRVRKVLDLDKLDELVASIKETGKVIVPVKVRPNGSSTEHGYTLVYGHRRLEAAKLAGLKEIDVVIDDVGDERILEEALIENVVREDMAPLDIAKALSQIKGEMEWTNTQVGAKFGMSEAAVRSYLDTLTTPDVQKVMEESHDRAITHKHLQEAKAGVENDADVVKILEKAAKEGLSQRQTRQVANEFQKAKDFGGDKLAESSVLKPTYEEITFTRDEPLRPPRKPKPVVEEEPKKLRWSWPKNPNIERLYSAVTVFGPVLEYMKVNKSQDPGALKQVLIQIRKFLSEFIVTIDELMEEIND